MKSDRYQISEKQQERGQKLVLVTGASRGIGRAIAARFAAEGYIVGINGRDEECLIRVQQELAEETGGAIFAAPGDVSEPEDVARMFSRTDAAAQALFLPHPIDVLVNNAGIDYIGPLQEMSYEAWRRVLATNLDGVFLTVKEAIPRMLRAHEGRIINISSVWGEVGASCEAAYSASKGGLNALTRALAKELAPSGIAVNAISCGLIDTRMNACFSAEELAALTDGIPAGRMAAPSEVAKLCLSLAEQSPYLTGQIIRFDGGWI